jgi:hypothetical protein
VNADEIAGKWLGLIYAHPDKPSAMQRDVLAALAVDKRLAGRDPRPKPVIHSPGTDRHPRRVHAAQDL